MCAHFSTGLCMTFIIHSFTVLHSHCKRFTKAMCLPVLSLLSLCRTATCLAVIYKKPTWEDPTWKEPFLKRCWPHCTCLRVSDNSAHAYKSSLDFSHRWLLYCSVPSACPTVYSPLLSISLYLCTAQVVICTSLAFHLSYVSFKYLALEFIQGCHVCLYVRMFLNVQLHTVYHQNKIMSLVYVDVSGCNPMTILI